MIKKLELENKTWFRAIKVVYVLFVIFSYIMAVGLSVDLIVDGESGYWFLLVVPVLFALATIIPRLLRYIFYYVYLGEHKSLMKY